MPCATTQSPNLQNLGPIIPVVILPSSAFMKALKENHPEEVKRYEKGFQAMMLIDTGASCTAIDKEISSVLNLKHRGVTHISTPSSNSHECLTYDIDLVIPGNQSHIPNIEVIETELNNQGINGLLGRDVLKNILFIYHGYTGQFTLAL
jgi:predicted aspartyl protease